MPPLVGCGKGMVLYGGGFGVICHVSVLVTMLSQVLSTQTASGFPTQMRGPAPKGRNANRLFRLLPPLRAFTKCVSGSNLSGFAKPSALPCSTPMNETRTCHPLGTCRGVG